jgi:hypothetical protein
LRAALRVCHDLLSVFGFGFSFFFDSRLGALFFAMSYSVTVLDVACSMKQEARMDYPPGYAYNNRLKARYRLATACAFLVGCGLFGPAWFRIAYAIARSAGVVDMDAPLVGQSGALAIGFIFLSIPFVGLVVGWVSAWILALSCLVCGTLDREEATTLGRHWKYPPRWRVNGLPSP